MSLSATESRTATQFTIEALADFRIPSDPQLSPDGTRVAFARGTMHKADKDAGFLSAIYVAEIATGTVRHFAGDDQTDNNSPRWSPDGARLAFVSNRANVKESQLYVIRLDGGEAEKLTDLRGKVGDPHWLPDGQSLVFTSSGVTGSKGRETPDPVVEDADLPFTRVWLVDSHTHDTQPITPADLNVYEYALSPDGKLLALVAAPQATNEAWYYAQLYVAEIASGETRQVCTMPHQIGIPSFSPDSQQLAFISGVLSDQGWVAGDIHIVPIATGEVPNLTPDIDHSPTWLTWLNRGILYGARHVNGTRMSWLDPASGAIRVCVSSDDSIGNGTIQRVSVAHDERTFAAIIVGFTKPANVGVGSLDSGDWQQITDLFPELADYPTPRVEHHEWQSPDGTPVEGYLRYPNNYEPGKPFPLVVSPHGGPSSSQAPTYGLGYSGWQHLLAAHGIGTFLPNPRGSWGRGHAYQAANVGDLGGGDWQDINAGIDFLIAKGLADPDKLGIFGWSYGGYMTAWAITQTDRFKCAAAGAAITNYESNYGIVSIRGWQTVCMGCSVYDKPDLHRDRSPLTHVKRVNTPTLLVHGERDEDVPPEQSLEFHTALKHFGVPVQCVIYPREPHGFTERAHQIDLMRRVVEWIERYLLT
ncbi:MAG: S9 family peptidase [Aggregatilineales bacterium]